MNKKRLSIDTLRFLLNLLNIVVLAFFNLFITRNIYGKMRGYDYRFRGYFVLLLLFVLISSMFFDSFDAFKIGLIKTTNLILSNIISLIFINIVMFFILCLIEGKLIAIWPQMLILLLQIIYICIASYYETKFIRTKNIPQKALVVYGDKKYKLVVEKLKSYQYFEFDIVKCVDEKNICSKKIDYQKYDCVITIDTSHDIKKIIAKECYSNNKNVFDVPSITDMLIKASEVTNFIDTPLFKLNKFGPSQVEKVIKRIIDLIGATLMLIITSPIMLITAIIIKLQDGGDVFFRQKRLTIDGKEFELVKFRSMIMNAEPNGKMIKAKEDDPRITPFGKFIRATRIDELPQIFNIFTGSMSYVGPRALRVEEYEENEKDFPEFRYRLKVKAGLTGYAQIYGKYNTNFRDKLLLDIYYIENFSIIEDFKLLLMTAVTMLKKDSTEGFK